MMHDEYTQSIFTRVHKTGDWQHRGTFHNFADAALALRSNLRGIRGQDFGACAEGVMVTFCPDGGAIVDVPAGCGPVAR